MMGSDAEGLTAGPAEGDFIAPPATGDEDERANALPEQEEFWRPPVRFGSVPVEKEPLGWDRRRGFRKLFPPVMLPFQVVERVRFGHSELEPNRLFWGDNLHVMRQLPNESIDLIYIDPPFFSGRQYNVIFGDKNELRSFSDIWEGGMPGYLVWLNARLYEMKRLLKKTGSIAVHLDYHAVHYVKVEMDKLFGSSNFVNEIIWFYKTGGTSKRWLGRKHDCILVYGKASRYKFYRQKEKSYLSHRYGFSNIEIMEDDKGPYTLVGMRDVWDIPALRGNQPEAIGYPTQKPEAIAERLISIFTDKTDVVADFFCGGGTAAAVAERLNRRWIACDQSRVAVAITADRLTQQVEKLTGKLFDVPDFTMEHWGVYEAQRLSEAPPEQFRAFVLRCFGARDENQDEGVHGYKGSIPVWVGKPDQGSAASASDVRGFANAIRKTLRYRQDNLRDGFMLAWAFRQDAAEAAERLRRLEQTDLNFVRLDMVRIDSARFREHVAALSTAHADYENFLTFVQPPKVEIGFRRIAELTYDFDASDSVVMNPGAKIVNVQWDFNHGDRFGSTPGYSFVRGAKKELTMRAQFTFPSAGKRRIACRVQDDMGGDGIGTLEIEVT